MHILCPLCGTSEKTLDHITLRCPFTLAIWTGVVARLRLPNIVTSENAEIGEWWPAVVERFIVADRRTANSFIMLVMRTLWLERNARVFERSPTTAQSTLRLMLEEWGLWLKCRRGYMRGIT
jgi:hypothetical protein